MEFAEDCVEARLVYPSPLPIYGDGDPTSMEPYVIFSYISSLVHYVMKLPHELGKGWSTSERCSSLCLYVTCGSAR